MFYWLPDLSLAGFGTKEEIKNNYNVWNSSVNNYYIYNFKTGNKIIKREENQLE